MDTSETYAKMCDCPEIQGKKERDGMTPKTHDFISDIHYTGSWIKDIGYQESSIWLPRQDQIQDMIGCVAGNHVNIMEQFVKADYFLTLEQKWLAFYMKENHNKVWDGKEWESGK